MRLARFRSADRDKKSDTARLGVVAGAVNSALASLDAELEGLRVRIDQVGAQVSFLYGTEIGYYAPREPAQEKELVEAEAAMMHALDRIKKLEAQQQLLKNVQQLVEKYL